MVNQSSRTAYYDHVIEGRATTQRRRIYDLISQNGQMTNRMIATTLKMETSTVSARVNELLKSNLIIPVTDSEGVEIHKPCPHTKKRVRWVQLIWPQNPETIEQLEMSL